MRGRGGESIHIIEDEGVLEHARRLGSEVISPALAAMAEQRGAVGEVRGLGAFWAIELVADRESKAPRAAEDMQRVAAHCKASGVWPFVAGNRIHVVPPCNTDLDDARTGLAVIDEALALLD